MKCYQLVSDYRHAKSIVVCESRELYGADRYDLERCEWVSGWDERITFLFRPERGKILTDRLANNLGWLIVSPRFRRVLEANSVEGLQYLPVRVASEATGEVIEGYQAVNILTLADAIARDHSVIHEYSTSDGRHFWSAIKYALEKERVDKLDMFRVIQSDTNLYPVVLVSERVRQVIQKNEVTGCEFLDIPVYDGDVRLTERPRRRPVVVVEKTEKDNLTVHHEDAHEPQTPLELIEEVVRSSLSLREAMNKLVDYCASQRLSQGWHQVSGLDFEVDAKNLEEWLIGVLSDEPPASDIAAFWFGLFNPVLPDGSESCGLYVAGAREFDAEDDWHQWACSPPYWPEGRYADSEVLRRIFKITEVMRDGKGISSFGQYVLCLGYGGLIIRDLLKAVPRKLLLGKRRKRCVGVGFDSGDWVVFDPIR